MFGGSGGRPVNPQVERRNRPSLVRLPAGKTVILHVYAFLLRVGGVLYVEWGIRYNAWNLFAPEIVGIDALAVVMVVFGVTGMLLCLPNQWR